MPSRPPEEAQVVVTPRPAPRPQTRPEPTPAPVAKASAKETDEPDTVPRLATARRLVRRGRRALSRGNRAEARSDFEQAIEHNPRNADAYAGLADAHFEGGQHERALHFAKMASRRAPNNAEHRIRLGDSYLRVGRRKKARAQYQQAAALGSSIASSRVAQTSE